MHTILPFVIVMMGALAIAGRTPGNLASWIVVGLTILGVYTSPDLAMRLMYVGAAMLGPILPYSVRLVSGLTIQPLLHYFSWESDAHRSLFLVTPDNELHTAAAEQHNKYVPSLISSGFVSQGRVGMRVKNVAVVNELLERGNGREWVILSAAIPASVQPLVMHCSISFRDGQTLVVSNYPWVDPNPPAPGFEAVRLPSIGDPNELVTAALTLAAGSKYESVVALPIDTDIVSLARERTQKRQDAEVRAGYVRYDASKDVYKATLRGAYRMFWVSLFPLNWIIDRRDRAREYELLAQMGFKPRPREEKAPGATETSPPPTWKQYGRSLAAAATLIAVIVLMPDLVTAISPGPSAFARPSVNVPNDLVVPDSFPGAVQALERMVGQPSHQLSGTRDDEPMPTIGVAISMRMDSAAAYVTAAQDAFLARGFYLFRTGERFSGLDTDGLALYPTRDPYEIMRAMDTNGANHGMLVDDVIAWLRREEGQYPIRFDAIGFDYIGGRLLGNVPDATDFARRFIRFCPDIQAEGMVTARSVGRDFKRTREIYCWWD